MITHHEGMRKGPYLCPAHLWTIGVGHLMYPEQTKLPMVRKEGYSGPLRKDFPLREGDSRKLSTQEVLDLLEKDLGSFERGVVRLCPGVLGNQGAFDALVSLSFNIGLGNLQRSQVRMKLNRGDVEGAAAAFMTWTRGGGRVLPGLVKRRNEERELFLNSFTESE